MKRISSMCWLRKSIIFKFFSFFLKQLPTLFSYYNTIIITTEESVLSIHSRVNSESVKEDFREVVLKKGSAPTPGTEKFRGV